MQFRLNEAIGSDTTVWKATSTFVGFIPNNTESKTKCPMCREELKWTEEYSIDKKFMEDVKENNKEEYKVKEKQMKKIRAEEAKTIKLKIRYGNHSWLTFPNIKEENMTAFQLKHQYTWKAFVDLGMTRIETEKYIKSVVFQLHPTFKNPIREVKKFPFGIKTNGWGTFDLLITIHWQDQIKAEPLKLNHYVSFDLKKDESCYTVKLKGNNNFSSKNSKLCQQAYKNVKHAKTRNGNKPAVWK
jgi:hypothetical protein